MNFTLGTVQFGLDYGISNTEGKVCASEVEKIINLASESGIETIDTAAAYGCAEERLGLYHKNRFKLISKQQSIDEKIFEHVQTSLRKLKADQLYGLLVHDINVLLQHPAAVNNLNQLKSNGTIKKVGVSVYTPAQLLQCLTFFTPDIVQIPFNIFDQRFLHSGLLDALKEKNIEVHARSLFLQGLLLMPSESIPKALNRHKNTLISLENEIEDKRLSKLEACLSFAKYHREHISSYVIGCCTQSQLIETIKTSELVEAISFAQHSQTVEALINPALWKL